MRSWQAYVDDQLHAKYDAAQKTTQWLTNRVRPLGRAGAGRRSRRAGLQGQEQYQRRCARASRSSISRLAAINGQLVAARSDLAQKASRRTIACRRCCDGPCGGCFAGRGFAGDRGAARAGSGAHPAGSRSHRALRPQTSQADRRGAAARAISKPNRAGSRPRRELLANDVAVSNANVNSLEASLDADRARRGQRRTMRKVQVEIAGGQCGFHPQHV